MQSIIFNQKVGSTLTVTMLKSTDTLSHGVHQALGMTEVLRFLMQDDLRARRVPTNRRVPSIQRAKRADKTLNVCAKTCLTLLLNAYALSNQS